MPDLNWNASIWGSIYSWPDRGEEWSSAWGDSESQWFGSIFPRLHRFLPAQRILEIAPGFGRWTKFLIAECDEFVGIDFSAKCVDACRNRFAATKHARFFDNDGHSLAAAPDDSFDLIFSFDSLVHAEHDVLQSYVPQILRKLSSTGVAFIHHSNLLAYKNTISNPPTFWIAAFFPNSRFMVSFNSITACADFTKYSLKPAFKQERTRVTCESLLKATRGVLAVRESWRKRAAKSSPLRSDKFGSITIKSGRSRHALINPSFPDAA